MQRGVLDGDHHETTQRLRRMFREEERRGSRRRADFSAPHALLQRGFDEPRGYSRSLAGFASSSGGGDGGEFGGAGGRDVRDERQRGGARLPVRGFLLETHRARPPRGTHAARTSLLAGRDAAFQTPSPLAVGDPRREDALTRRAALRSHQRREHPGSARRGFGRDCGVGG